MKFYVRANDEIMPRQYDVHLFSDKKRDTLREIRAYSMIIGGCVMMSVAAAILIDQHMNNTASTEE